MESEDEKLWDGGMEPVIPLNQPCQIPDCECGGQGEIRACWMVKNPLLSSNHRNATFEFQGKAALWVCKKVSLLCMSKRDTVYYLRNRRSELLAKAQIISQLIEEDEQLPLEDEQLQVPQP